MSLSVDALGRSHRPGRQVPPWTGFLIFYFDMSMSANALSVPVPRAHPRVELDLSKGCLVAVDILLQQSQQRLGLLRLK